VSTSESITIVVPCYNEAGRLRMQAFERAAQELGLGFLFVDDGSKDRTRSVLEDLAARMGDAASVLVLEQNAGKAEAVRRGLLQALDGGAAVVGYVDADLATPLEAVVEMVALLREGSHDAVIGSRIAYLGANIERRAARHYLGRVFATAASLILDEVIYDTQCGAKVFRASALLRRALSEPFHSRWAFDVELLGRLLAAGASVREMPLRQWVDVAGSKLSLREMLGTGWDLLKIAHALRRYRG